MASTVAPTKPRHDVRNAWISLILIPLFLVVADGVLHGLLGLMGIDESAVPEETPTLVQSLMAGIPYALVMMLPGIGGFWFGRKAQRDGDRRGRIPSAIGAVWVGIVIVGSIVLLVASL
jgi:hypothetical protein